MKNQNIGNFCSILPLPSGNTQLEHHIMRKLIGIALIIGSLFLGYQSYHKITDNSTSVEILDVEIGLSNKSEKEEGYLYAGLAVLLFVGGAYLIKK